MRMSQILIQSINKTSTFCAAQAQGHGVSDGLCGNTNKYQVQVIQNQRHQQYSMASRDKATRQLEEYVDAKKVNFIITFRCY